MGGILTRFSVTLGVDIFFAYCTTLEGDLSNNSLAMKGFLFYCFRFKIITSFSSAIR